jgi:cytochrome c oxidase assembly protein subunit 11
MMVNDTEGNQTSATTSGRSHRSIVIACSVFALSMGGMAYAAVPLYELFCQVTGYGGTTQRTEQASQTILDRDIRVRFDANIGNGLSWDFKPVQRDVVLKIGETTQVSYTATNTASVPTRGQATFNVTPQSAGAYFNKLECFCFTETELQPGESLEMPVVFFVDPAIVDQFETRNIQTITLSYTFFPHEAEKPVAAAVSPVQEEEDSL